MTDICPVEDCDRPRHDNWSICVQHAWELERDLAELPSLGEDLDLTLSRQRGTARGGGGHGAEKPPPFDYRASEVIGVVRSTLVGWIRDLDDNPLHHPADTLPAMARWLLTRLDELVTHPAAQEIVTEIAYATEQGRRAVDNPPQRVFAGPCGEKGCTDDLYAVPGRLYVTCRECGTGHEVAERRERLLAELHGRLLTGAEIARMATYFGGTIDRAKARNLVKTWAGRGLIVPHGVDRKGDPTYPFGEVYARLAVVAERSTTREDTPTAATA